MSDKKKPRTKRGSNYDYAGLSEYPHMEFNDSGFQSPTSSAKYIQSGSNPYNGYLHPELSMANPVAGGGRGERMVGGRKKKNVFKDFAHGVTNVAKDIGTGVATQALTDFIMNPAVDAAILEGAETAAVAAGRKRGRPAKVLSDVTRGIVKGVKKAAIPAVNKAAKTVESHVNKTAKTVDNHISKGIDEMVETMMKEKILAGEKTGGKRKPNIVKALKSIVNHPITKKVASEVYNTAMPIIKEQGKKMVEMGTDALIATLSEEQAMGGRKKNKLGRSIGNTFKKVGKMLAPPVAGVGTTVVTGNPFVGMAAAIGTKEALKGQGGRAKRGAIVKRIMAERGVALGAASKIVKEEGLY